MEIEVTPKENKVVKRKFVKKGEVISLLHSTDVVYLTIDEVKRVDVIGQFNVIILASGELSGIHPDNEVIIREAKLVIEK